MRKSEVIAAGIVLATLAAAGLSAQGLVTGRVVDHPGSAAATAVFLARLDGAPGPLVVDTASIDQRHLRFIPNMVVVPVGSTVRFVNSDPIMHNVFSPTPQQSVFNLGTYPSSESRDQTFTEPGQYLVLCHIHPEMVAWIVVTPTPHYTQTDAEGYFALRDVPPGRYTIVFWNRNSGRSEMSVEVAPGGVDLSDVRPYRRGANRQGSDQ